jgi:adenosylmethionine---8-amino-7-oxononanoate aminotransferase
MNLQQFDSQHIWHPFTPLKGASLPIVVKAAEGVYLHTVDGRKILDAVSSWWVNLHGHAHPHIAGAIAKQALELEHVIFAGFTHEPAIQLTKNLLTILPADQSRIFFSDNGSTAVEVALKMAFQYWHNKGIPKNKIIALEGAYHGDTFGAMAVGERGIFTKPFEKHLFEVDFIPFPSASTAEEAIHVFTKKIQQHDVAAFIYEPLVQGAAGMRMFAPDVLKKLLHIAKQHDVICIADEVFTGFGRTGKYFASEYIPDQPDIMSVSKGITGGFMPLGVTSCTEKIVHAFLDDSVEKTFFHGHSYTANPIACAAANASFELLTTEACQNQIAMISRHHETFVHQAAKSKVVLNARQLGTICAIELKHKQNTSYINPLRKKIYQYFLERNILLRPLGNILYIVPPYCITSEQLEFLYTEIQLFLKNLEQGD